MDAEETWLHIYISSPKCSTKS